MIPKNIAFAACLIVTLAGLSLLRSSLYIDEATLWRDTVAKSPCKARPHNNLGRGYKLAHKPAEALKHFERALEIDPDYGDALNNLAILYATDRRTEEAVALLRRTVSLDPDHLLAHYNLAMSLYGMGHLSDAAREYEIILQLAPKSSEALFARQMLTLIGNRTTAGH